MLLYLVLPIEHIKDRWDYSQYIFHRKAISGNCPLFTTCNYLHSNFPSTYKFVSRPHKNKKHPSTKQCSLSELLVSSTIINNKTNFKYNGQPVEPTLLFQLINIRQSLDFSSTYYKEKSKFNQFNKNTGLPHYSLFPDNFIFTDASLYRAGSGFSIVYNTSIPIAISLASSHPCSIFDLELYALIQGIVKSDWFSPKLICSLIVKRPCI